MSFILDALRKSEQERQRNLEPGVAELRAHDKRGSRAFWLPLVMLLVGLNLSLLTFLWIKGSPKPTEITAPETDSSIAAATTMDVRPQQAIAKTQPDQTSRMLSSQIPPEDTVAKIPKAIENPTPVSPPAADSSYNPYRNLPSMLELTLAGTIDLKPLRLDIHVYSEQPAERFVFINMKKYREGDPLVEGPLLEAITREGVVLVHQGQSFILDRE